jgi:hypothetical protein
MKNKPTKKSFRTKKRLMTAGACFGLIVSGGMAAYAQTAPETDTDKVAAMEKQNQELQQRLAALEDVVKKEGLMPSTGPTQASDPRAASPLRIFGIRRTIHFH